MDSVELWKEPHKVSDISSFYGGQVVLQFHFLSEDQFGSLGFLADY